MFSRSAHLYDALYAWKDYAAEAQRVHAFIQARRPGAGQRLLDVACGTGSHLAHLRQWYTVEGLDLDPNLLEVARQRLPGVPLHVGDMVDFDLGRQFDAVTCLFSSIGYVVTEARLRQAARSLVRHLAHGGVLVVEPWFHPGAYHAGRVSGLCVDEPDLKIARQAVSAIEDGRVSVLNFHYLVATPAGVEHFVEAHRLGLFTHAQYMQAFTEAGLDVAHDPAGLTDRGAYVGVRRAA